MVRGRGDTQSDHVRNVADANLLTSRESVEDLQPHAIREGCQKNSAFIERFIGRQTPAESGHEFAFEARYVAAIRGNPGWKRSFGSNILTHV